MMTIQIGGGHHHSSAHHGSNHHTGFSLTAGDPLIMILTFLRSLIEGLKTEENPKKARSSIISDPDFAESSAPAFSLSAGFGSRSNPRGELGESNHEIVQHLKIYFDEQLL